jgi:hypothetical protein
VRSQRVLDNGAGRNGIFVARLLADEILEHELYARGAGADSAPSTALVKVLIARIVGSGGGRTWCMIQATRTAGPCSRKFRLVKQNQRLVVYGWKLN